MKHRRRWSLLVGSAAAAIGFGTLTVTPAGAVGSSATGASHAKRPVAYVPLRTAIPFDVVFNNMDYNGGPLMPSNTDYAVYWGGPAGSSAYPKGYTDGINQWFTDLAHDSGGHQNTDSVSAQYQDLTGAFSQYAATFGGGIFDTQPYPASQCPTSNKVSNCLTDAQIQTELERFVSAKGLKKDLSHEYFLLTPPGVETCFSNTAPSFGGCSAGEPLSIAAFCAYHQNTGISPFLIYADDPYVPGNKLCDDGDHPNGFWDGELSGGLSHEQNESVTDPIPNDAWTNGAGTDQGFEVGDQCVGQFGTPLGKVHGQLFNQLINGRPYWYQEEWSNDTHQCLQRLGPVGQMPTATFTVTAGSGLTLNFDATGSTAPGGVAQYVWQMNAVANAQTVETTSPTFSYTFPSAGAYSVGLTVFASSGLSTGTGGIVTTGQSGTSSGFTVSKHPLAGQSVSFSALANVSAKPVLVYFWEFGDGTIGVGQNPTHVYARRGSFVVSLVMFSGVGSAFPGDGAGPISQQTIQVN